MAAKEAGYVFSEFEIDQVGIAFDGEETHQIMECISTIEEEMETKTVTKNCRGIPVKKRTKGTGAGTLNLTGHIPMKVYTTAHGMKLDSLIDGVYGYGYNSAHKTFSLTVHVVNEDDEEKLKAYPNCVMNSGVARKVEDGSEEVAELELEIGVMPDEYGNGLYEALVSDLTTGTTAKDWMTKFKPATVQTPGA